MFSHQLLAGRHALVTGASSGLGRHFAKILARAGASVTLVARRLEAIEAAAAEINAGGGAAGAVVADVTHKTAVEAAFDAAEAARGGVTVLINNAGIADTARPEEFDEVSWDAVLGVNLRGAWLVAQSAGRRMINAQSGGAIVNIGSITGERVAGGVAPYAISKAGVHQMTRALALEWARHDIAVNALAPGYVETDINRGFFDTEAGQAIVKRIPQRRIGELEDLDAPLLMLAGRASRYLTGAVIPVDGGHLCSGL